MFKALINVLILITCLAGMSAIISDGYVTWYNWKYKKLNIEAVPVRFFGFKYIPSEGYHLEAVCKRAGVEVRIPKIEAFNYFNIYVEGRTVTSKNCDIIIVQNIEVIAPLKDYDIRPVKP